MNAVFFCVVIELMKNNITNKTYSSTYQLKLPLEISKIIEISDPVYTFCEVMDCIDLKSILRLRKAEQVAKDMILKFC